MEVKTLKHFLLKRFDAVPDNRQRGLGPPRQVTLNFLPAVDLGLSVRRLFRLDRADKYAPPASSPQRHIQRGPVLPRRRRDESEIERKRREIRHIRSLVTSRLDTNFP